MSDYLALIPSLDGSLNPLSWNPWAFILVFGFALGGVFVLEALFLPWIIRRRLRAQHLDLGDEFGPYDAASLLGGGRRLIAVALQRLLANEQLRTDDGRRLTRPQEGAESTPYRVSAPRSARLDAWQERVLSLFEAGTSRDFESVVEALDGALAAQEQRIDGKKWMRAMPTHRVFIGLFAAVWGGGVVRLFNDWVLGRPLGPLFVVVGLVGYLLFVHFAPRARLTQRGLGALDRARKQHRPWSMPRSESTDPSVFVGAVDLSVSPTDPRWAFALFGFAALDPEARAGARMLEEFERFVEIEPDSLYADFGLRLQTGVGPLRPGEINTYTGVGSDARW